MKSPAQTHTSTGKTDQEKSMELSPTTQLCSGEISFQNKTKRPKDMRSPIRPPTSTDTSPNKKLQKDKTKNPPKQKTVKSENVDSSNKFKILEKTEIENSPQVHKHKNHKNKRSNSPDLRPNNEPQNNSGELPSGANCYY